MQTPKTIDLRPNKQVYRSAAVDVDLVDALEELVDNAVDNRHRWSEGADDLTIEIELNGSETRIRDNSGGLEPDRVRNVYALGETFQSEIPGSIGAYGVGAKKAVTRLAQFDGDGSFALIRSRARGAEEGFGFRIDSDWFQTDDNWTVDGQSFEDMEEGTTEIILNASSDIWGRGPDAARDIVDRVKRELSKTYAKFIRGTAGSGGTLTITVNGQILTPPEEIPWAFPPFDGLHPRRFVGKVVHPEGVDEPVEIDVTVGLMRTQSAEMAGTDIYCQDRLVVAADTTEVGGFGPVAQNGLGNFTHHKQRLKIIVELRTEGDSADLPWDAHKSTIDTTHPVARAMYSWLQKIARPYYKATTSKVREAFVEPYDASHEHAANGGKIEVLDYTGRQRVTDRPEDGFPRLTTIFERARLHAEQGIKCFEDLTAAEQVAYEREVERAYGGDSSELEILDTTAGLNLDTGDDPLLGPNADLDRFIKRVNRAGSSKARALRDIGMETVKDIADAKAADLMEAEGVGSRLANKLQKEARRIVHGSDEGAEGDSNGALEPPIRFDGEAPEGKRLIPLVLEEDVYQRICKQLGDEYAGPDRIADVLAKQIKGFYSAT